MNQDLGPAHVEIYIEELVLHGFAPVERYAIGDMVQRELTRLFAERGVPPSLSRDAEIARVDGGAFDVSPGSPRGALGIQVAQAVYGGLAR